MASLAKDTAIYGLSSIVGRFLNYLLVPLYTEKIKAETGGYGEVTDLGTSCPEVMSPYPF